MAGDACLGGSLRLIALCFIALPTFSSGMKVLRKCYSNEFKFKEVDITCKEPLMVDAKSAEYYSPLSQSCSSLQITQTVTSACKRAVNCTMPLPYLGDLDNCLKCIRVTYDCIEGMCSAPPIPVFGSANVTQESRLGTTAGYSCADDFTLYGSVSSTCKVSVEWNFKGMTLETVYKWKHLTAAVCSLNVALCPKPRAPSNQPTSTHEGNCLEFVKINKTWQEARSDCTSKGGMLLGGATFLYVDKIVARASPALDLTQYDAHKRDEFWIDRKTTSTSGVENCNAMRIIMNQKGNRPDVHHIIADTCTDKRYYICKYEAKKPTRCTPIEPPRYGVIIQEYGSFIGDKVTLGCLEGYKIEGPRVRECLANGTWSGQSTVCKVVDCGLPPLGGASGKLQRFYTSTDFYSMVHYSCAEGYDMTGESIRRCTGSGTWSGKLPTCQIKPAERKTVTKCAYTTTKNKEVWVHLTCARPYMLQVEHVRFYNDKHVDCSDLDYTTNTRALCDRTLNCSIPVPFKGYTTNCLKCVLIKYDCVLAKCPAIVVPPFSSANITGEAVFRSVVKYTCDTGFSLSRGSGIQKCWLYRQLQADGSDYSRYQWIDPYPFCSLSLGQCPSRQSGDIFPVSVLGGSCFEFISVNATKDDASKSCTARGGRLFDRENVDILTGPFKNAKPPLNLTKVNNFKQKGSFWTGRTRRDDNGDLKCQAVIYEKGFFSLIFPHWTLCSGKKHYICEYVQRTPQRCGQLFAPAHSVIAVTGYDVGQTATFTCVDGYSLNGTESRTCLANGEWSGESPFCEVVDCGKPPKDSSLVMMVHYDVTEVFHEAFHFCPSNFNIVGRRVRVCQQNGQWSGDVPQCVPKVDSTLPGAQTGQGSGQASYGLGPGALVAAIVVPIIVVGIGIVIIFVLIKRGALSVPMLPQQNSKSDGMANPMYVNFKKDETTLAT